MTNDPSLRWPFLTIFLIIKPNGGSSRTWFRQFDNFWNIRKSVNFPPFPPFPVKFFFFSIATNIFQWWIFPWHLRFARCLDRSRLGLSDLWNFRSQSKLKVHWCVLYEDFLVGLKHGFEKWLSDDFPIILGMECHHPTWRTPWFFRGIEATQQFWYILSFCSDPNFETWACCGLICRRELAQQLDFRKTLVWCGRCPRLEGQCDTWDTATQILIWKCPPNYGALQHQFTCSISVRKMHDFGVATLQEGPAVVAWFITPSNDM